MVEVKSLVLWRVAENTRILEAMENANAGYRRHLTSSPFNRPTAAEPVELYEVDDRVSHDVYGMGSVIGVEPGVAVLVDFGSCKVRVSTPYGKLSKL